MCNDWKEKLKWQREATWREQRDSRGFLWWKKGITITVLKKNVYCLVCECVFMCIGRIPWDSFLLLFGGKLNSGEQRKRKEEKKEKWRRKKWVNKSCLRHTLKITGKRYQTKTVRKKESKLYNILNSYFRDSRCIKTRHLFAFMGFLGFANVYAMRVNLSGIKIE